ncbi:MAG: hypothetical protein IPL61_18580 [Myxococcales bacterium]|nr:hypothetical protein [Myxococcales bacterium]
MMVSHGRGGVTRAARVKVGSVVDQLLPQLPCPMFLVSARPEPAAARPEPDAAAALP